MRNIKIIDKALYYEPSTGEFALSPKDFKETSLEKPDVDEIIPSIKPLAYSFCLEISDVCNLTCDYCFNSHKSGKTLTLEKAISQLDYLFGKFPNGEKYFVDLSGKGEPLLNLKTIIGLADYCKGKSDELNVEVLLMFVSNGTLLTSEIAKILQKHGVFLS